MSTERERVEREAVDLVHHHPERCDRDDLANAVINFILRERAAAFEKAANKLAAQRLAFVKDHPFDIALPAHERALNAGWTQSLWMAEESIRALAAAEREQEPPRG
jgi:hypothetical protein